MIVAKEIEGYLDSVTPPENPVLARVFALSKQRDFPAIGPQVGRLLYLLARLSKARRVLELGSGFGYSAIWFGMALPEDGEVHLTDTSADYLKEAENFLAQAGLRHKAQLHRGEALEILAGFPAESIDLVFNDIDKEDYERSIVPVHRVLRPGGLFLTDNTLWYGKLAEQPIVDKTAQAVDRFNRALFAHKGFESLIIPIRDGLALARKT